jgi:hypothetical protein
MKRKRDLGFEALQARVFLVLLQLVKLSKKKNGDKPWDIEGIASFGFAKLSLERQIKEIFFYFSK